MSEHLVVPGELADAHIAHQSRRLLLIGVAALIVVLTNAVTFLLPPLLPVLQAHYQVTSVSAVTWIFTLLTLGGGAGFVVLPKLSDVIGDRSTAVIACLALTVGAVAAAVGDSYPAILIGAAVMGFGGAAQLLPLGFLRRALGEAGLAISVAVLVIATGVGIVVGMIGGGFIVEHLSLRDFFAILAACFALTTLASFVVIPRSAPADKAGGGVAIVGTVWLIVWVGLALLAMTQGLVWGWGALATLAVALIAAAGWVRSQRRSSNPVFDPVLFTAPYAVVSSVVIALIAAINAAFLVLVSTFAQTDPANLPAADAYGLGLNALQTGELMVPFAITFLIGGVVAERPLAAGRGPSVLVSGAVLSAVGLALLVVTHDREWSYLVAAAIIGFGCAIVYSACFALVQNAVDEREAGMAGSMVGTAMAIGFAFGSALITCVLGSSTIAIPGTDVEVATEGLFGVSYVIAIGLAVLIVLAVGISTMRRHGAMTGSVANSAIS
ncbi:MFS transporter [Gordonia sp. i37]|uniref:MFS transporter n=1 Tax=Gordonia sp. i37 TaxID=1961707 RepID=UPI0009ACEA1D|nr:MFS transporter [Gordonia sp. i37]OPX16363.1 MFS transporter [Gordonia sp. i37]